MDDVTSRAAGRLLFELMRDHYEMFGPIYGEWEDWPGEHDSWANMAAQFRDSELNRLRVVEQRAERIREVALEDQPADEHICPDWILAVLDGGRDNR